MGTESELSHVGPSGCLETSTVNPAAENAEPVISELASHFSAVRELYGFLLGLPVTRW